MNLKRLEKHIKICKKNLKNNRIKCCALCPFEEDICFYYPDMKDMFIQKRVHHNILLDKGI